MVTPFANSALSGSVLGADGTQKRKARDHVMNQSSVRSVLAYALAASMGGVSFAACSHVSAVPQPAQYMAAETPLEVWVIRRHNDSLYRIAQPRMEGDTLIGFSLPRPGDPLVKYQEIPLNDVRQMRAKQSSPLRTGMLIAGIAGVAYIAYSQLVGGGGTGARVGPGQPPCDCDFDEICACV